MDVLRSSAVVLPRNSRSILSLLNYATPVLVTAFFLVASALAWLFLRIDVGPKFSRIRKSALAATGLAITASYAAQALQFSHNLSSAPDDVLVHGTAQAQLWATLTLILVSTASPLPHIWLSVMLLNLVLEGAVCALTYSIAHKTDNKQLYGLGATQTLICCLLIFSALLLFRLNTGENETAETQSLLSKRSKHSQAPSASSIAYHTLAVNGAPSQNHQDGEDSEFDDDSADDDDEEDDGGDKEVRAQLQQRLADNGSWWTYIKEFKVFLPYLIPNDNLRIQFYIGLLVFNILIDRVLVVLEPRALGAVIDALTMGYAVPWKQIFVWILLKIAVSSSCGIGALNEMLENRLETWSHQQLSIAAFDHVMGLSMGFHDEKDSGEIIKAIEQAGSLNSLLRAFIVNIFPGGLDIVVAMFYVAYLFDIYATLIMLTFGIFFVFATYHLTTLMTAARRVSANKDREESRLVYESVSNWFTVSYFNRRSFVIARIGRAAKDLARAELWSDDLYTYLYIVQDLSELITLMAMSILVARRVVSGSSTVGDFVTLQTYWGAMTIPLYVLSRSYRKLNSDLVDAERLLQLFKQRPVVTDRAASQPIELTKGEVSFENVKFAYAGRQSTLDNLNFAAKSGQMTALVGETGSGKSTIFKLLMRFHDVTSGKIMIDGQDLRDVTLDSLRECFGFVPQETVLFNMSILENVRYGRLNASDAEVYAACRAASIHDKILSFPKGYASKVGERGVKLSGGERQRIAIARVFLKNAQIVLLDEATSAMDSETESKIQSALRELVKGRTTFVIAHRLSTVVEADNILVLDNGRVVESGTHQELLLQNGRYTELWRRQAVLAS